MQKTYPSKILLFGEYTVLNGGQALAIPYHPYYGYWAEDAEKKKSSSLIDLYRYIDSQNSQLNRAMDMEAFHLMLKNGGYFQSNIPRGMGLGSSAALTACLYDLLADTASLSLEEKKHDLGLIESFFHGKSSGFDALVSLQQSALLVDQNQGIRQVDRDAFSTNSIYLLFTNSTRKTKNLVSWFQSRRNDAEFDQSIDRLTQLNDQAIGAYLENQEIMEIIKDISRVQYEVLKDLIVDSLAALWHQTLVNSHISIKLLGAAGGGCYLLFAKRPLEQNQFFGFKTQRI